MQPIQTDEVLTGKSLMERDQHHNIYFGAVFIQWHNIHNDFFIMTVYFKQTAFSSFYGKSYTLKAGSDK